MKTNTPRTDSAPLLAIVAPCYNEQESIPSAIETLSSLLHEMILSGLVSDESFIYFVDDGSSDKTWSLLRDAYNTEKIVRALRLSRNFGHQYALLAGLMMVKDRCDAAVSIDADMQQDPLAIPKFVAKYREGAEIVFGVRHDRKSDNLFKKTTAQIFYYLMRLGGVPVISNHADYRLLSKKALIALSQYGESNLFLRAICTQLGLPTAAIYFEVKERLYGRSKYSLRKMFRLAIHGITSFSIVPLRLVAILGFLIFSLSILMGGYVICHALVIGDTVPGWASTTLPIYFIGGVQLLCLGIVGEYVGQVLSEVKRRPRYINDIELF
jgi:polyisoprenyl-phosphate glycosyltransferase